jgi:hypothetical protein
METTSKSEGGHLVHEAANEFRKLLKEEGDKKAPAAHPKQLREPIGPTPCYLEPEKRPIEGDIPAALLEEFDKIVVKAYPGGRSEAIRDLILQEIQKRKGPDKFYDGVKWNIPRSCFILFALPQTECRKLATWQENKDQIITHIGPNGEILLLNNWKLAEFTRRKTPKTERRNT